ncbi:hypothetical protein PHYSODRAFT_301765 [Phytophthora sojae]|uniref:Uncharacterized protein n=1 Tax=Phytophthora sojae (strain P6497) TaxID=1094619 RepID=G4ZNQ4_PHYSP|nr:hypothetical protein PHYSODRAFT_301765 [Phytophthora sojae]EGZ15077.1 hypothetical protein PHYSODRAFT_301765 [Phytophthora sojae]|eukprot:XP_009528826.1 hypothetical protein PHYSODRAFT_301765 [Phytophthora sojae]
MSYFTARDRKVVPENRVRELFSEVDWVATMNWVEEQLKAKGLMPKNVDTSALDGMVAFPGERPAAEASADERKQSALNRMSQLIDKQNQRRALDIYKTQALNNFGPPKRPLEDSAVSGIDIQTKRQNMMELSRVGASNELMMESVGNARKNVQNIYQHNPWLVRIHIPPTGVDRVKKSREQLSGYYLDASADVYKMKTPPNASSNDTRLTDAAIKY